ncbi:protein POOR HOMOLOGOUS SYNAPSIS 1 [Coffea eugenioides]|uniref:protein POOR HOMOLOGOUS SYNAPSIS 1 n=1 Tax=Coffea eugenioides TaxID=49369 RepID=UPI000F610E30|nr:protein POOR HOMOLOGOUS SYNAPSIS 1 [Coffea eugenioides]
MAGSPVPIDSSSNDKAMAMNPILEQWQVQYARFVHFPPISSVSSAAAHHQPLLVPRSNTSRKIRKGGVWFSTSSSSSAATAVGTACLKLIGSSDDAILNLSVHGKVLEEHRVLQLHFTWPQVSCVSGFPARGSRAIFVSYNDCLGQVQKFTLRFLTIYEAEAFIDVLKETLYNAPDKLQGLKYNSELSSQSEFIPPIGLPYRAEEDWRHTTFADTSITSRVTEEDCRLTTSITTAEAMNHQGLASLNCIVDKHSNDQEAIHNPEVEDFPVDFPPSFTSFLRNCCPAAEKNAVLAALPEENDLKAQIARYLEDSSFQDILVKVEKVINEIGDGVML